MDDHMKYWQFASNVRVPDVQQPTASLPGSSVVPAVLIPIISQGGPWKWYVYLHLVDFSSKCGELYHTWMLSAWNQFWFNWIIINFDTWRSWRLLMCCVEVNDFVHACYLADGTFNIIQHIGFCIFAVFPSCSVDQKSTEITHCLALEIHCCSSIAGLLDFDSPGFKLVSNRNWAGRSGPQGLLLQKGRCLSKFPKIHLCSPSMPRARSPKVKVSAWSEISSTSIFARNGNKCDILRERNHSEPVQGSLTQCHFGGEIP